MGHSVAQSGQFIFRSTDAKPFACAHGRAIDRDAVHNPFGNDRKDGFTVAECGLAERIRRRFCWQAAKERFKRVGQIPPGQPLVLGAFQKRAGGIGGIDHATLFQQDLSVVKACGWGRPGTGTGGSGPEQGMPDKHGNRRTKPDHDCRQYVHTDSPLRYPPESSAKKSRLIWR